MPITAERRAALVLPGLAFLLPFEPRAPVLALGSVSVTMLEGAALLAVLISWPGLAALRRSVLGPPVLLLGAYAAAHLLSAFLAEQEPARAFLFALRMAAMALLAAVVATAPFACRGICLGLAAGGAVVAALAVAEGLGFSALDLFLNAFREQPFNVGGLRRASAGSEYPNLAAACIGYALVAGAGWAARPRRPTLPLLAGATLLAFGLLATSSRGALLAAALGLGGLAVAVRDRVARRPPLLALGVLAVSTLVFLRGHEVLQLRLASEGVASWYAADYQPAEPELRLVAGERSRTPVRVTNLGRRAWTREGGFHLSYHWYTPEGLVRRDGARTPLPGDVLPGQSVLLSAEVKAPEVPGEYLLLWDMVQEHTAWFSGQGVPPARARARVSAASGTPATSWKPAREAPLESAGWRPSRRELWSLAFLLWKDRPVVGIGPDNYRWSYGPRSGRGPGDTRVYANNLLLEALATTGLLGALALAGALGATAKASWNTARRTTGHEAVVGATLFGLVTLVAAQGTVDYVLAFTGHYILLGLVVGGTAALSTAASAASATAHLRGPSGEAGAEP